MSAVATTTDRRAADAAKVHRSLFGYLGTKAVLAAVELGVFDALEQAPGTAEEVGARVGLAERPARVLLLALLGEQLVQCENGRYRNDPAASAYLVSGKPDYIGALAAHQNAHFAKFARLTESLRDNRPLETPKDYYLTKAFGSYNQDWAERLASVTIATHSLMGDLSAHAPLAGHRHLVDLGCGSCVYSIEFARANPDLRITAVDNGPVADIGRRAVAEAGLSDRVTVQPGDIFNDSFPECDAVLLSNVMQGFERERARKLIKHIGGWLPEGGELLIHTHLPTSSRFTYEFGLILMVNNPEGGEPHDEAITRGWLAGAGFKEVSVEQVSEIFTLVRARK